MMETANTDQAKSWTAKATAAQERRHENIKAMDYFAVKLNIRL